MGKDWPVKAPQTEFEICLTASAPQNKSLSFCLTPSRIRAINVITNLRPSEKLEKGRSLFMYEPAMPLGFALMWLGPALADQKPKPRPTSLPTCTKPAERCPSPGPSEEGKKTR